MRVRDDGNVGIATSAPSARLHIVGSGIGTTNTLLIQNSGGTNLMSVLDNGTVTIPNGNIITNGSTAFAGTMSFRSSLTNLPGIYITFEHN